MDKAQALDTLKKYRAWIHRESNDMPDPVDIGRAIDAAVLVLSFSHDRALLSRFNAWRRDDSDTPLGRLSMPCPVKVAAAIDSVIENWGKNENES